VFETSHRKGPISSYLPRRRERVTSEAAQAQGLFLAALLPYAGS